MKIIKLIGWIGFISMTIVIGNGFLNGNFLEDGGELLTNPWGIVSLVDLYVGFVLFSIWITLREKSLGSKIVWISLMMILGFFTGSIYVLKAAYESNGDYEIFLMGKKLNKR